MLILSRHLGESIIISNNIEISIIKFDRDDNGQKVRIGIEAPSEVQIFRSELAPERRHKGEIYAEESEEARVGGTGEHRPTRRVPWTGGGEAAALPPPQAPGHPFLMQQLFDDDPLKQESAARALGSAYADSLAVAALSALQAALPGQEQNPSLRQVIIQSIKAILGRVSLVDFIKIINAYLLRDNKHPDTRKPVPPKEEYVKALFADLPDGYDDRAKELAAVNAAIRRELAEKLAPALKAKMQAMPHGTYDQKVELVREVNAELRQLDLAIKHPKTGQAAILKANTGNHPKIGSFELGSKDPEGGRKTFTTPDLATLLDKLELMDAPARREPLAEWQDKVGRKRRGVKRD
jgi:carbon storage regulator